jgi:hypothetical protein
MLTRRLICVLIIVAAISTPLYAQEEAKDVYFDHIATYFDAPYERVVQMVERGLDTSALPILFTVVREAEMKDVTVLTMHQNGLTWASLLKQAKVSPAAFYVKWDSKKESSVFAPILAKFDSLAEGEWSTVVLADDEVHNLANLKFLSEHFKKSPSEIAKKRDVGATYESINMFLDREAAMKEGELEKAEAPAEVEKMEKKPDSASAHNLGEDTTADDDDSDTVDDDTEADDDE